MGKRFRVELDICFLRDPYIVLAIPYGIKKNGAASARRFIKIIYNVLYGLGSSFLAIIALTNLTAFRQSSISAVSTGV